AHGLEEARPAGARVVLGVGREQGLVAHDAVVGAVVVAVPVHAGERGLGGRVLRDLVLLRREAVPQLVLSGGGGGPGWLPGGGWGWSWMPPRWALRFGCRCQRVCRLIWSRRAGRPRVGPAACAEPGQVRRRWRRSRRSPSRRRRPSRRSA